ncbi:BTAD domain-containing putative transcriptional regulator [Actinomycetes bacterium KLBMP 9759]
MPTPRLDVLVLGPTSVMAGEHRLTLDRMLERAVLTRLAMAGGNPVPDERLAADLWGDLEPHRLTARLRVVVSRLRATLGEHSAVVSRSPAGYQAAAHTSDLVAAQAAADRMHAAARAGVHATVRDEARAALECWRGSSLGDLRAVPFAAMESERLDAWRVELTVHRLRAEIALGGAGELIAELAALAGEYPLHEPIAGLLAHALYRSGRQADALDRLARLRRALADELGVDPAPDTAELELRLLRQDPGLLATPLATVPAAPKPAVPRSRAAITAPSTSFLGRDGELAALTAQLREPGVVTLVGGPGSGKSRLAIEAAARVAERGRQVVVVELAPVQREDAMATALNTAAGVDAGAGDAIRAVASAVDGALLLIDNAEHLVEQVSATVRALRTAAPRLTVLVTSQRPLLLAEESQRRVAPLPRNAAMTLFTDRASADAFPADAAVAERAVATICAAVDELPLGIELAAGLTRTLSVTQLAGRVSDRLRLLVGGRRDAAGRHTSLRAALDWSHELLDGPSRAVLRRIGAFSGGFSLEAAEFVAALSEDETGDVAPALADLVDRSLVTAVGSTATGGHRFTLLETVRDYALAQLARADETDTVRGRHLSWCLEYVRELGEDDFASPGAVPAVFAEWPNLLSALELAAGTERATDALRLANALHTPWVARGWFREAVRHFARLSGAPGLAPAEQARTLSAHGYHALQAQRLDEAAELLAAAAEITATLDDPELALAVRYYLGFVDIQRCRPAAAIAALAPGEELARAAGLLRRAATFADALGTAYLISGEPARAAEQYRVAIAIDRERGDEPRLSVSLCNLAQALLDTGDHEQALRLADESDEYARRIDDHQVMPTNAMVRTSVAIAESRLDDAEAHGRTAVATSEPGSGAGAPDLADVLIMKGELGEARELLDEAYRDLQPGTTSWFTARPVSAALALASGDVEEARRLATETRAAFARSGFAWPRYAKRLDEVEAALDAAADAVRGI